MLMYNQNNVLLKLSFLQLFIRTLNVQWIKMLIGKKVSIFYFLKSIKFSINTYL